MTSLPAWVISRRSGLAVAAAGCLVATVGVTGCGAGHTAASSTVTVTASSTAPSTATSSSTGPVTVPMGAKGSPRGGCGLKSVDRHDSSAVALEVAIVSACWDTALDKTPMDAQRRAIPLLTPRLAAVLSAPLGGNGGGDSTGWADLVARHGWMSVTATIADEDGGIPDTQTTAKHEVLVIAAGHAKGWTGDQQTSLEIVTMTRATSAAPWQVLSMTPVS
ncbi:hypothetical protein [Rudaeicoccus suwonensis]|uniref:Lipoprotein n=1 Tax=Rudaeicoccus suwonensis TaxID=657409 RepID=A0A561DVH6_9MICO|nr:hypothetical protein [Rudaeicoccus suwonensis]TWE07367.1 hypothetical protein BKA23_3380 [Rudaeicoccus suwonensis]